MSGDTELAAIELRENVRQFRLSSSVTDREKAGMDQPDPIIVQIKTVSDIGSGSVKQIQFMIGALSAENMFFGAYFSQEVKQVIVLSTFAIVLILLIACMAFRCHKYRKRKSSDSQATG